MTTRLIFEFPATSTPAFRGVPPKVLGFRSMAWFRAVFARWRERRMLEELDDRMLRDIGISRSQALAEAAKPFWRR